MDFEKLWCPEEIVGGWGDVLGLWDGNPVKSDCYDHYTTTDVINKKKNFIFSEKCGKSKPFPRSSVKPQGWDRARGGARGTSLRVPSGSHLLFTSPCLGLRLPIISTQRFLEGFQK